MLPFIALALQLIPMMLKLGEDVMPLIDNALAVYNSGVDPTDEQWDALHAEETRLTMALDAAAAAANP